MVLGSHTGTHVDAPSHVGLHTNVDVIPLESLIEHVVVVSSPDIVDKKFTNHILEKIATNENAEKIGGLLFKTEYDLSEFSKQHPYLTPGAAELLAESKISTIGIESFSIESYKGDGSVHRKLLSSGKVIIEGLVLSHIPDGQYLMACLPLKIEGGDGAPARTVLIRNKEIEGSA
ncbi:MAG: cyclase family protein [Methermicoccaceae archaeon]